MAKKKSDQLSVISDQEIASGEEQGRPRNDVTASRTPYEVKLWKGLPQYVCVICGFDTLSENAIFTHIEAHQLAPVSPQPPPNLPHPSTSAGTPPLRTEEDDGVFEVELIEVDSTMDAQGNEHKKFTIKEN